MAIYTDAATHEEQNVASKACKVENQLLISPILLFWRVGLNHQE